VGPERFSPRASAITVVMSLALFTSLSCQVERPEDEEDSSRATPSSSREGPQSDEPDSDVQVQTFRLASHDDLLDHLADVGWTEAVVLAGADAKRLELWGGDATGTRRPRTGSMATA